MAKPLTAWEASDGSSSLVVGLANARVTTSGALRLDTSGNARVTELATFTQKEKTAWSES